MNNQNNLKIIIFTLFLLTYASTLYITDKYYNEKKTLIQNTKLIKLETHYKIFIHNLKVLSDNIFDDTMNINNVKKIISTASKSKNKEEIHQLRLQLEKILNKKYSQIKKKGILQYHFVFPDNTVFLRMHKTSKYGDNLTNVRPDFSYVNQNKKIVRGFSHGRTAHGFRNVYPLFNEENEHIGAMEISFSSENLQNYLSTLSGIHSHFLIKKEVFDSKAWTRDDMVLKYTQSAENEHYMLHLSKGHIKEVCLIENKYRMKSIQNIVDNKLKDNEKFSISRSVGGVETVLSFYPILQNVTKKVVAWIVSYEDVELVVQLGKDRAFINTISFFILLSIAYFVYKNLSQQQTIRKREKELVYKTKEQELLLSLFDKGDSVLFKWKTDECRSVEYVSSSISNLLEYSKDDFLKNKLNYISCIHQDDFKQVMEEIESGLESNNSFFVHKPYRVLTKTNKEKWVLDYTVASRDSEGKVLNYMGYILDITAQKNNDKIIEEKAKLASLSEMIRNISHQWRQPLSVISSAATGIKVQKEFDILTDKELLSSCTIINDNAQYLSRTIEEFRTFINGEKVLTSFNLNENIQSFIYIVKSKHDANDINFILDIDKNLEMHGYPNDLHQCLINIFNNAKEALFNTNEKMFFIRVEQLENEVKITLKDNAGGIKEDVLLKIYEPYFTTKHQSQGTGLGLYMVHNIIVKSMHGKIEVKNSSYSYNNKNYKGASFIITLPLSVV